MLEGLPRVLRPNHASRAEKAEEGSYSIILSSDEVFLQAALNLEDRFGNAF